MNIGYDAKRIFHNTTGLGNYGRDLVRILNESFPNNKFFLYSPKPKKVTRFKLTEQTIEVLPKGALWKKFSSIWRQGPMVRQLKENNIEIYHGLSGEIPKGLKKANIKSAVTIHDLIFIRYPELYTFFDRKIHFKKFQYAAKNSDKIIAISEQTKKDIIEFLKVDPEKIDVIYQGCNAAFKKQYSQKETELTTQKFKLPKEFILNVGTVEKRKNLLNLVRAIENSEINLVVVGNSNTGYAKEVKEYIHARGFSDRVHFLKNVSTQELAQIYQMASIFVYPSIFEGFGIPIIEALFSKTPVISSKESCFSEAGGPHSMYINPENYISIEQAIKTILEDKELQEKMKTKGFAYAQQFNDDVIAKQIFGIYKVVLS